jgi:hypothetical protein
VFVPELELAVLVCGTSTQIISLTVGSFDTLVSVDLTALEYNMSKLPSEHGRQSWGGASPPVWSGGRISNYPPPPF